MRFAKEGAMASSLAAGSLISLLSATESDTRDRGESQSGAHRTHLWKKSCPNGSTGRWLWYRGYDSGDYPAVNFSYPARADRGENFTWA